MPAAPDRVAEKLVLLRLVHAEPIDDEVQKTNDGVERSAELVRHGREEFGLQPVRGAEAVDDLLQLARLVLQLGLVPAHRLDQARVLDRGSDLVAHRAQEIGLPRRELLARHAQDRDHAHHLVAREERHVDHRRDAPVQELRLRDKLAALHRLEHGGIDRVGDHARRELDRGIEVARLPHQAERGLLRVVALDPAGVHAQAFHDLAAHRGQHLLRVVAAPGRDRDRSEGRELLRAPVGLGLDPSLLPQLHDGGDVAHRAVGRPFHRRDGHHHRAGVAQRGSEVHLADPPAVAVHLLEDPVLEVVRLRRPEEPSKVRAGEDGGIDPGEPGQRLVHEDDPALVVEEDVPHVHAVEILAQGFAQPGYLGRRQGGQRWSNGLHEGSPRAPQGALVSATYRLVGT